MGSCGESPSTRRTIPPPETHQHGGVLGFGLGNVSLGWRGGNANPTAKTTNHKGNQGHKAKQWALAHCKICENLRNLWIKGFSQKESFVYLVPLW